METRRFGRTGHMSSVAIFGAFALSNLEQEAADRVMEQVISAGVNHIDVAPSYGQAEERLGPWLARERERFFLGCKTMERGEKGAAAELRSSLERLDVEQFDLYQIHAVTNMEELDTATRSGGALDAMLRAREEGLIRYIGITGHGYESPAVFLEALERFDFDSVLFPVSFVLFTQDEYREKALELLEQCRQRDVGVMAIKAIAKGPYGDAEPTHNTWYRPFTDAQRIRDGVNFALSHDVTGLCTPGDADILPTVLRACQDYSRLDKQQKKDLMASGQAYEPLFRP